MSQANKLVPPPVDRQFARVLPTGMARRVSTLFCGLPLTPSKADVPPHSPTLLAHVVTASRAADRLCAVRAYASTLAHVAPLGRRRTASHTPALSQDAAGAASTTNPLRTVPAAPPRTAYGAECVCVCVRDAGATWGERAQAPAGIMLLFVEPRLEKLPGGTLSPQRTARGAKADLCLCYRMGSRCARPAVSCLWRSEYAIRRPQRTWAHPGGARRAN